MVNTVLALERGGCTGEGSWALRCLSLVKARCMLSGCSEAGERCSRWAAVCFYRDCLVGKCAGCWLLLLGPPGQLQGPVALASSACGAGDTYSWHFPWHLSVPA